MSRLFVIGDSFSVSPPKDDKTKNWPRLLTEKLYQHTGRDITLINSSMIGSSQDWCWTHLQIWLHYEMTSEDRLVVCLTHPSRVWFLERLPEMSNANVIDLDKWVTKEEAKAIELYIRYIQRPHIDLMNVNNRLAYLAYQVQRRGLQKPIVVKCFDQTLDQGEEFPELLIADGILMEDIQYHEFERPEEVESKFWQGIDARYNHICLRNHEILAERLLQSFITGKPADLKNGFHKGMLKEGILDDEEFCRKEMCMMVREKNLKNREEYRPRLPWAKRVGIKTGLIE